jgi:dihydrofolate reductase
MRKLILGLAITLDGYIEGPKGEYDWCFTDQDYGLNSFFERIDASFIGRKSYEMMQQHQAGGGEAIPGMPKMTEYVFSNTLSFVKDGSVLVSGDVIAEARNIKNMEGKDIWLFGGASLTDSLMQADLIDEIWLSVHPVLLGRGKLLFSEQLNRKTLKLLESKTYETGLVSLRYGTENYHS